MKKKWWILPALLLAFGFFITGCPTPEEEEEKEGGEGGGAATAAVAMIKFNDNSGEWSGVNEKLPFKFFVVEVVGGSSNSDGYGGIQFQFQGAGASGDGQIATTGDWTSLAHSATDKVYFILDLSGWANYNTLLTASWAQLRVNDGASLLGTYQGYIVPNSVTSLTKPAGASAAFTAGGGKPAIVGYATKTLPKEIKLP